MYCSDCIFFSDLGRCRNGHARRTDCGYFDKPCNEFLPMNETTKPAAAAPAEPAPATKICKHCGKELPLERFAKATRSKDGLQPWCRDCASKATIASRKARKAKAKAEKPADAPANDSGKVDNLDLVVQNMQLLHEKQEAEMALDAQKAFCKWVGMDDYTPQEGMLVILFLMDGTCIITRWDNENDKQARDARLFLKGRYPKFWCYAWQMYDIITTKGLLLDAQEDED